MHRIRFFTKLAFICNICFLAAIVIQYMPHPPEGEIVATTIIIGYVFAVIVNLLVNLICAGLLIFGKLSKHQVPLWLLIANFLFLIPELIIFFK